MNKIKVFDGLRFIFCISIFLNHCGFMKYAETTDKIFEGILHNGAFGVMFFIVLSGFCMELGYGDKFQNLSWDGYKDYIKKRMIKIYPLYVVTMLYVFIYQVCNGAPILQHSVKFVFSLTMLQTLTLRWWNIFNSAAWFISCLFVIYLVVPMLFHFLNKITSIKRIYALAIGSYVFVMLYEIFIRIFVKQGLIEEIAGDILTYSFPPYRIWHFVLGALVAKMFKCHKNNSHPKGKKNGTLIEIGSVSLVIVAYVIGILQRPFGEIWSTIFCLPILLCFIYVMAWECGFVSKMLSCRFLVWGGKHSMEIYLLHYVVIWFGGDAVYSYFFGRSVGAIINEIFVLFGITVLFALFAKARKRA